jgi:alkanesulfonate monooxygenase SsuD/methylene tetrahydromethanopterin reductase-like flavin-dependent oxidoreductase (luciferase family)
LAAATTTVRLGTMVSSRTVRHPVTLAKEAMTLDHVSGGRFSLGAGGAGF